MRRSHTLSPSRKTCVWVSHPTGNANVRAVLDALQGEAVLGAFHTTLGWSTQGPTWRTLPTELAARLQRRAYHLTPCTIHRHPWGELLRLAKVQLKGISDIDAVYQALDRQVACALDSSRDASHLYCYEDGALATFRVAQSKGIQCIYDLPIAYWRTSRRLMEEEAERMPEWRQTLTAIFDSPDKCARKDEELSLADCIICPSQFVADSIPAHDQQQKAVRVIPFGSPDIPPPPPREINPKAKLRVLFAGSMSQRKGLGDLFAAMKLLSPDEFELHVMGSTVASMGFYRRLCPNFIYHATRPHAEVLRLMQSCDVLVLPSLVEGRALVQQEALACGLPIIVTKNAGAEDLVADGKAGFLIPIRSPEIIAEKLQVLRNDPDLLTSMQTAAPAKAAEASWHAYRAGIVEAVTSQ